MLVVVFMLAMAGGVFGGSKADAPADASAPPKDAQWTLYCRVVTGPDHVARAKEYKNELIKASGMKDWYVVHEEDQSVLYYGYYRAIAHPKDKKESDHAQSDRKAIDKLIDAQGNKIVPGSMFVAINAADPAAPAEWDLRNAKGDLTLEIAVYKENQGRKQAAVDSVKAARAQGIEAYYFHGPNASSVCIGAWPMSAIRQQDEDKAEAPDQTSDILVLPNRLPLPAGTVIKNRNGDPIHAVAPVFEPLDPSLIATMAKFPSRAVNGEVTVTKVPDPATGQPRNVEDPSVVVPIPKQETASSVLSATEAPPTLVAPPTPSQAPGAGQLRSLGQ